MRKQVRALLLQLPSSGLRETLRSLLLMSASLGHTLPHAMWSLKLHSKLALWKAQPWTCPWQNAASGFRAANVNGCSLDIQQAAHYLALALRKLDEILTAAASSSSKRRLSRSCFQVASLGFSGSL